MNRSILTSIVLTTVTALWLMSGAIGKQDDWVKPDKNTIGQKPPTLFRVQAEDLVAKSVIKELHLQGQIQAIREIDLKVEIEGRVLALTSYRGQRVDKGSSLLQLSINGKSASLLRARAELDLRQAEYRANKTLKKQGLISQTTFLKSQAELAMAKASVKEMEVALNNTQMNAPFAGIINALNVEVGAYLNAGETFGNLVDDSAALITADVPQQYRDKLNLDMPVVASLLDGKQIKGRISYLSNEADPQTRTYRLEAKLTNDNTLKIFGQSAAITVPFEQVLAHRISPSLLELDTEGDLQVKALNKENKVTVYPVKIVKSQLKTLWISGMPESVRLITIGHGFVSPGQIVKPVFNQKG